MLDQVVVQVSHLLLGDLGLFQGCRDLLERQIAPLPPLSDQPSEPLAFEQGGDIPLVVLRSSGDEQDVCLFGQVLPALSSVQAPKRREAYMGTRMHATPATSRTRPALPRSGATLRRMSETTVPSELRDVQAGAPDTRVSLTRVGVRGVEKVIHVASPTGGAPGLFFAELEAFVDLNPDQAGVHMSRFEEVVNEAIDAVVLSEALRAEDLAAHIAQQVRERQGGCRAEVRIEARYPDTVKAPASGLDTQEIYKLHAVAVASSAERDASPASRPRA